MALAAVRPPQSGSLFWRRAVGRLALAAAAAGALTAATPSPALAAETTSSELVIIQPDDVVEDDLYAGAVRVLVEGVIEGDLVAFAAEEVVVAGAVEGSVLAAAPSVVIEGTVGGAVRAASVTLRVDGPVGGDVVASVGRVELGEASSIEGDLQAWAVTLEARGRVGGDVRGAQGAAALAGSVGGDVAVTVGRLTVVDDLAVSGNLNYRSSAGAEGLGKATVGGAIAHQAPVPPNLRVRALQAFGRFLTIVVLTVAALTVAYMWPDRSRRAVERVRASPWKSWGKGAAVLVVPFLLVGLTALATALTPASVSFVLLIVMAPIMLAVFGATAVLCVATGAPAVGRLGWIVSPKLTLNGAVFVGSALAGLVWLLPVVGWLVPLTAAPLGLGAWMSGRRPEPEPEPEAEAEAE